MAAYTYELFDIASNLITTELPLQVDTLPETLNTYEAVKLSLPLNSPESLADDWYYRIRERRTGVLALRDGQPVWSGLLWDVDTEKNGLSLALSCINIAGFFDYQTLDTDTTFTQTDQHTIMRTLGQYVETQPGGDININWGSGLSGILRDRTEYYGVEHKNILELWRQLAGVIDGVDFRIRTVKPTASTVEHLFLVGSPLGVPASQTGFVMEYIDDLHGRGGNLSSYKVKRPGGVTAVWALGAGEGSEMVQVLVEDTSAIAAGYPRIVKVISHKSVSEIETLTEHAEAELAKSGALIPSVTVRPGADPTIGTYQPGDFVRLEITSPEFPSIAGAPGYTATARIYKTVIRPRTDEVELVLQPMESEE